MKSIDEMTQAELRDCETACRERRGVLQLLARREYQVKNMRDSRLEAEPGASIHGYCEDMVYHARRLNACITGKFNDSELEAFPDSSPHDMERGYFQARRK